MSETIGSLATRVGNDPGEVVPIGGGIKRIFDLLVALSSVLILAPTFVLITCAIKVCDGGPVFYRHRRIGFNGRHFDCLKFRTMVVDADDQLNSYLVSTPELHEEWWASQKIRQDPRVTRLGAILRKYSLDELPQIVNVLRGEMSIVGPRPIVEREVPLYDEAIRYYLRARPGLTGLWQVSGRNNVQYAARVRMDKAYVCGWSFISDVVIIIKTIPAVLLAKGTY